MWEQMRKISKQSDVPLSLHQRQPLGWLPAQSQPGQWQPLRILFARRNDRQLTEYFQTCTPVTGQHLVIARTPNLSRKVD